MDPQTSVDVGQAEPEKTWTDAVVARLWPSDHHLSDDEIFEIITAVSDREVTAELLAAKGVTLPMYCLWRSKYRHLTFDEFRQTRRHELWRARCRLGVLTAVALLGGGGILFGLARAAEWNSAGATEAQSSATPLAPAAPATPPVERDSPSGPLPATIAAVDPEPGYKIQVAAAPTVSEARVLVERLTSDGYSAYLFRATVSDQEVFRVRVGPLESLSAAEEMAAQLHRAGYTDAWITQ